MKTHFNTPLLMNNQRENRLRESLGTFITFYKARTVYLWRLEMKQNFSQIQLLEILYVLFSACKQKSEKPLFFPDLPCPQKLRYSPWGGPTGSQVCPGILRRFRTTPASEMGHTFQGKPSYYHFGSKQLNFEQPSLYFVSANILKNSKQKLFFKC